jgi:uncharacterized oxidoreductase
MPDRSPAVRGPQLRDTTIRVFEIVPPIVRTDLRGNSRRADEDARYTMTPQEAAAGIVDALEHDRYEVPLGAAVNLHDKRDALFPMIND